MTAQYAYVIQIGERFFYKFGKGGRVMTAWCLAGGKLYQSIDIEKLNYVTDKLDAVNKKYTIGIVRVIPES
jgi:hypothetical protein